MKSKNIILLVEDDELDVISVERSLKKLDEDYELLTAYNGIEALQILNDLKSSRLPDVILLDLNMPKMNGVEFLKAIKSDSELKGLKVIVMTTSGDDSDRKAVDHLGVSGYLIKPLNFNSNTKRNDSMEGFVQFHLRKILASNV